jgi:hypothetical protein
MADPERALGDLELERWLADDLPAARIAAATAADRARLDELRAEHAAFLAGVDVGGEVRAIRRRAGAPARRVARPWWIAGGALAAAAALAVVVLRPAPGPDDDLRAKGGVGLVIHVAADGTSRAVTRDGAVHPGDRIRFQVSAPGPGHVAVVGVDAAGVATVYHPYGGSRSAALPAGDGGVLPGAIALDAALGDEAIYAVYAAHPFALDAGLFAALRGGAGPPGTATARVVLHRQK